jgi:hypothetical protein
MSKAAFDSLVLQGKMRSQLRDKNAPSMVPFRTITLEHINVEGEEPLTFTTRSSLKDYCKKHKLRSGALGYDA